MDKKGQVAIEGFTTLAIILFLYATLVIMTNSRDADLGKRAEYMDKRDSCIAVQSAFSGALSAGDGTTYEFSLNSADTIYISGHYVDVGLTNTYSCQLLAEAAMPVNLTHEGLMAHKIRVSNTNGSVNITIA